MTSLNYFGNGAVGWDLSFSLTIISVHENGAELCWLQPIENERWDFASTQNRSKDDNTRVTLLRYTANIRPATMSGVVFDEQRITTECYLSMGIYTKMLNGTETMGIFHFAIKISLFLFISTYHQLPLQYPHWV